MPGDNFISGNDAYVKIGVSPYSFGKWGMKIDGGVKSFYHFGSPFRRTLPGGMAATITLEGPYNAGNMPLVVNGIAELHLGWAYGIEIVVFARIANIDYSTEISAGGDPAQCSVTAESEGAFQVTFA